jgi:mono/diheme cytochrome c family protein
MSRTSYYLVLLLSVIPTACNSGRHSASGFSLPAYGDVDRGKAVFVELKCSDCHRVSGVSLPQPEASATPVVLGGETLRDMTDGYLVASIINPSARITRQRGDARLGNGKSRMPVYADNLTIRQLTDLVVFLQSHYWLRSPSLDIHQF